MPPWKTASILHKPVLMRTDLQRLLEFARPDHGIPESHQSRLRLEAAGRAAERLGQAGNPERHWLTWIEPRPSWKAIMGASTEPLSRDFSAFCWRALKALCLHNGLFRFQRFARAGRRARISVHVAPSGASLVGSFTSVSRKMCASPKSVPSQLLPPTHLSALRIARRGGENPVKAIAGQILLKVDSRHLEAASNRPESRAKGSGRPDPPPSSTPAWRSKSSKTRKASPCGKPQRCPCCPISPRAQGLLQTFRDRKIATLHPFWELGERRYGTPASR